MSGNNFKDVLGTAGTRVKDYVLERGAGFWVGLVAWVLTFVHTITCSGISHDIFAPATIGVGVAGIILFPLLSLFKKTSSLAPVALMICDFLCLTCAAGADGIIDYLATQFFDGISLQKIFNLPFSVWFSVLSFVVSFILASVAIYLPQLKKKRVGTAVQAEGENE